MHTGLITQVSPLHSLPTKAAARGRALAPQQALDLRDEFMAGVSTRTLAAKYGVSQATAYRIATGKMYAELSSLPNPRARMPWVDPTPRRRGGCEESELRVLLPMLKAYPGRRALVKLTKTRPHISECTIPGLSTAIEQLPQGGYGVYVHWAGVRAA
jgi:hypothetical protein